MDIQNSQKAPIGKIDTKIGLILGWVVLNKARVCYLSLLVVLSILYFSFGTYRNWPYKVESDGKYYYQYLVSGFYDHDFDFSNNYRAPKYEWMEKKIDHYEFKYELSPITHKPTNPFTSGQSILWFPFFLGAKTFIFILNNLGFAIDPNPWGQVVQYAVMYSSVIYGVLTLYLLHLILARYFDQNFSSIATFLVLTSTNLFYYIIFEPSLSHVYDLFTYIIFLFLFLKATRSTHPALYVSIAVAGALHVLVRTQNIITILIFSVSLFLVPILDRSKPVPIRLMVVYAGTLFIGLLPIALINKYLYGTMLTIPQGRSFLNLAQPHILEILFSFRNGLFSTHPSLLLALAGFILFYYQAIRAGQKKEALFFFSLLLAFMIQVYINASASDWWAGDSFGQRRLISSFPLFGFGFAYLIQQVSRTRPKLALAGVLIFSIFGIYLTFIHVFLWSYDEPNNILAWMFFHAPREIFINLQ